MTVTPADVLFRGKDLDFEYQLGNQKVHALRGVSFEISKGSFLCLSGPSGSGKSTLLNLLGLIESPQKGTLSFERQEVGLLRESEKNKIRRFKIGFIFQSFHLFPVLRADENVEYFLSRQGLGRTERQARVRESLEAVGLWEHRFKRPLEMSGGQRQRVAIARALAKRPDVLIADEPTASLDQTTGREIIETLVRLNQTQKLTVVVASHDAMVQKLSPQRFHLVDGRLNERHEEFKS